MNELVKELMPYLQKLADKLDSSAMYLWQLQLQQVKVAIVSDVIQYILIGLYLYAYYKTMRYFIKREDEDLFPMFLIVGLVGGCVALGLGCMAFGNTTRFATMVFNPEYYALQEIIKMVK